MAEQYRPEDLEALARDTLSRAGVAKHASEIVARDVALSEMAGLPDGGFMGLLRDLRLLRYGRLRHDGLVSIEAPSPAVVRVSAGHGFAAMALAQGFPHVLDVAERMGIGMLHLHSASEPGAMAAAMVDLAANGLAGFALRSDGSACAIRPDDACVTAMETGGGATLLSSLLALAPPPADHPLEGPVAHRGWLVAADPAATGIGELLDTLPRDAVGTRSSFIVLEPELLAQIVTA